MDGEMMGAPHLASEMWVLQDTQRSMVTAALVLCALLNDQRQVDGAREPRALRRNGEVVSSRGSWSACART